MFFLAGCPNQPVEGPKAIVPNKVKTLVIVGDESADLLIARLQNRNSVVTDVTNDGERQLVVVVQDAMTGAMPAHRDLVELREHKATVVLWVMTNSDKVDDLELLELEELERTTLTKHGFPGDEIHFAFDSERA